MARNPGLNRDIIETIQTQIEGLALGGGEGAGVTSLGTVYFVDSTHANTSDNNAGTTPSLPLATIDAAVGKCTASSGDIIMVAPGHAETVTAAITLDVVGVTILGQGHGLNRPYISCATDSIDEMTITAANCIVDNIGFNESTGTTSRTSFINVAASNAHIRNCHFDCGQYDLEQITIATAGDDCLIEDCVFRVTANGPDAGIEIEGTSSNLVVRGCTFDGGSDTNAWDAAAINSTTAATGVLIEDCDFLFCLTAQEFITLTAITEPPIIRNCTFKSGAALASQLNGPSTFYVDSGKGNDVAGAGTTRHTPCATLDYAIGLCSANAGDTIIVSAGHAENLTTATGVNCDVAGVKIIGEGQGADRPTFSTTAAAGSITVGAASVWIENIKMVANFATGTTTAMTIAAAADQLTLKNCEFADTSSANEFLIHLSVATTVDDLTIDGCKFIGLAGSTMSNSILFAGTSTNCTIVNSYFFVDSSDSVVDHAAGAAVNFHMGYCTVVNADTGAAGYCLEHAAGSTGIAHDNRFAYNKIDAEISTGAAMWWIENYASNTIAESGLLDPTTAHAIP